MKEINLGIGANPYIESSLQQGPTLSRYLRELSTVKGVAFTNLPDAFDISQVYHFENSGILTEANKYDFLTEHIAAFLINNKRGIIILETFFHKDDPFLVSNKFNINYFLCNDDEIYFFISPNEVNNNILVIKTLQFSIKYPFIGISTSLPNEIGSIKTGQFINDSLLHQLCAKTEYLLIGAYDETGIIVWRKSK